MSTLSPISADHIKKQVSKIVRTDQFKKSKLLSDFLKFIVQETLDGNEQSLKEYVIATEVLQKKSDFNPQLDAVVRIHARRLRKFLEDYYLGSGIHDAIRITMPKGRYIPVFEKNTKELRNSNTDGESNDISIENVPLIAIIPFENYKSTNRVEVICSVLAQELVVELSRFSEIGVISNYSTEVAIESIGDMDNVKSHLGADYLIKGSCVLDTNELKIYVELHSVKKNQILWAESYLIENYNKNTLKNFKQIVKTILARTCGYFGIIYRDLLRAHNPDDFNYLYAIYWHNRYHRYYSEEAFQEALEAIDIALKKYPDNSLLNSFKAQLLLDLCAMDIQGEIDYFNEGSKFVKKALQSDPVNQHALQIMAWKYLIKKDKEKSILAIEKCLSVNPNNSLFMCTMGFGYICVAEYEKGLNLLSESVKLNPYSFWLMNAGFCYYYLNAGDFEEALYWAEKIKRPGLLWDHVLCISANGLLERKEDLSESINILYELSPNFNQRAPYIVDAFLLDKKLQNTILRGLVQAGIDIKHIA